MTRLLCILGLWILSSAFLAAREDPFADIPDLGETPAPEVSSSAWRGEAQFKSKFAAEGRIFHPSTNPSQRVPNINWEKLLELRSLGLLLNVDLDTSLTLLRRNDERKRLSLVARFHGKADSGRLNKSLPAEQAYFHFGFRQLYASFFASFGPELEVSAGKQPYAQGVSIYSNPMNFLDDSRTFFETKNNWQLLLGLSWPNWAFRLRYMPVFRFRSGSHLQANILEIDRSDYHAWEYAFSFLESHNRRQFLTLESSLFLGQSSWQWIGYIMEKRRYNWEDGFYMALGFSGILPFRIEKQTFRLYGEGLLGNGISKIGRLEKSGRPGGPDYLWYNTSLDTLQFRGLVGLQWSPAILANFDLYLEYRYDGSALPPEQLRRLSVGLESYSKNYPSNNYPSNPAQGLFWKGLTERKPFAKPFALTQHVLTLAANWRNIAEHLDLQASYFFSLPDASSLMQLKASLHLSDLEIYALNQWYLPGFSIGAFGSMPYLGRIELGIQL